MPPFLSILVLSSVILVLPACRFERAKSEPQASAAEARDPAPGTYVLGTAVLPQGAVPADAASDMFPRGTPVFLSVEVSGATREQAIEIDWVDSYGHVLGKEQRVVPPEARYAAFSTGPTAEWSPGTYRVVVIIDGRRVNEQTFTVA